MHPFLLVVLAVPLVSILLFGVYSAVVILHGIATFPECPRAHAGLLADMEDARRQLKLRGFTSW